MSKKALIKKLLLEGKTPYDIVRETGISQSHVYDVKHKMDLINNTERMVEHHTHYKEIHGYDETVWLTDSEHKKLHNRLRKEGLCNIHPDKLCKISQMAHKRTCRYKLGAKISQRTYNQSKHGKQIRTNYKNTNVGTIGFTETLGKNVEIYEQHIYNQSTGSIIYSARFRGKNGYKLPVIDI